jgi:hypothetical protein
MAETAATAPKILQLPATPLWYYLGGVSLVALVLGLGVAFGFVLRDHFQAEPVTEVFRTARTTLVQYHSEKNVWPAEFTFNNPPAEVRAYGFTQGLNPLMEKVGALGTWRFSPKGLDGKSQPVIVFKANEMTDAVQRILGVVDGRLDDGEAKTGKFRYDDQGGSLTLSVE